MLLKALCLAAVFSLAIFMHFFACFLYNNWWPLTILFAYVLAPLPLCLFRCGAGDGVFDSGNANAQHWAVFLSATLVTIIVGLPFVLVHTEVIELGAALIDLSGFLLIVATFGLAVFFSKSDSSY